MKKGIVLAALIAVGIGMSGLASAMESAAFKQLRSAADGGDVKSMIEVGQLFLHGDAAAKQNPEQAFQYFKKAADRGSADGMYQVGMAYRFGQGTEKDMEEARRWLEKAAEKGNGEAKKALTQANFLPPQPAKSSVREAKPAEAPAVKPQVAQTPAKEEKKPEPAPAESAAAPAKSSVREAKPVEAPAVKPQAAQTPTPAKSADAPAEKPQPASPAPTFKQMQSAANSGDVKAMVNVGQILLHGDANVTPNPEEAFQYFKKAADRGSADGMYWVGMSYRFGKGEEKSIDEARSWMEKAAKQGSKEAENALARPNFLATEAAAVKPAAAPEPKPGMEGVDPAGSTPVTGPARKMSNDPTGAMRQAYQLYFNRLNREASRGDFEAAYLIGVAYLHGDHGAPVHPEHAFKWLQHAAKQGYGPAMREVSAMYRQGLGTAANPAEADYWDQMAKLAGY